MIALLLKLFPSRFVSGLGDEWLADTRREYAQARRLGMVTLAQWVLRTLAGTVVGACVAHAQEVQLAFSKASEQRYFVVSGGQMAFMAFMKITADQASPSKAGEVCGAIPQAQASVHEAGIYTLTTQDLAVLGRAGP